MVKDAHITEVFFRKFKDMGDVIALFPDEPWNELGHCASYMHVGQHGPAAYIGLLGITKLANPREYLPLKRELESLGYNLVVRQKHSRSK